MGRIFCFVTCLCALLFGCSSSMPVTNAKSNFGQYKELFYSYTLPIDWKRSDIGRLGKPIYGQDKFNEISLDFLSFVPEKIIQNDSITSIRALYQLPSFGNLCLFVIGADYIDDYYGDGEPFPIKNTLYLVIYNDRGEILSFKQIAGSHVDNWEQFILINEDFTFQTRWYGYLNQYIKHPEKNYEIGLYKMERHNCTITEVGEIKCDSEIIIGYFDIIESDYVFVAQ